MRALIIAAMLIPTLAHAQHNHAQGHAFYQGWTNQVGRACCNDQDCGTLRDTDERTNAGRLEVRIEGHWCPIKPHHYLKSGNAPDWSTAHVCVLKGVPWNIVPVCDRLLCYQPKPAF